MASNVSSTSTRISRLRVNQQGFLIIPTLRHSSLHTSYCKSLGWGMFIEARASRASRAMTKSLMRCKPIHIVLGPGGPSCLRPRYPPKLAIKQTNSPKRGGFCGGKQRLTTIYAACHSWRSKSTSQSRSGQARPSIRVNNTRQAMIMYSAKHRFARFFHGEDSAPTFADCVPL